MREYEVHEVWLGINDGDEGERYEQLTPPAWDEGKIIKYANAIN